MKINNQNSNMYNTMSFTRPNNYEIMHEKSNPRNFIIKN